MRDAFICHSEKDFATTLEIALGLEAAGYTTWYYERDNVPGESYLIQVGRAIEDSRCVVLLVSRNSLDSNQVTSEVVRAYEARIPFVPLLLDVAHREVQERQQVWRQALVTATSLAVPPEGLGAVLPRIVRGLETLGIRPGEPAATQAPPPGEVAGAGPRRRRRAPWAMPLGLVAGLAAGVAVTFLVARCHWFYRPVPQPRADYRATPDSTRGAAPEEVTAAKPAESKTPVIEESAPKQGVPLSGTSDAVTTESRSGPPSTPAPAHPAILQEVDLLVGIADSTGEARGCLMRAVRDLGMSAAEAPESDPLWDQNRQLLLRGTPPTRSRVLGQLRAKAALLGDAQLIDVAEGYGLYAVRAVIRVDWIPADSTQPTASWTAAEKATRASRDDAARAALDAAIAETIRKLRAAGRVP